MFFVKYVFFFTLEVDNNYISFVASPLMKYKYCLLQTYLTKTFEYPLYILKTKSNFTLSPTEYIFTVFYFDQIKYCNELLVPALTQFTKNN